MQPALGPAQRALQLGALPGAPEQVAHRGAERMGQGRWRGRRADPLCRVARAQVGRAQEAGQPAGEAGCSSHVKS